MDCLIELTASALCLIAPAQFQIRADVSEQIGGSIRYNIGGRDFGGGRVGRVQVEMPLILGRSFSLNAGFEHTSLINTNEDRGEERVYLGFAWMPVRWAEGLRSFGR